ncbi:hypothetical protein GP486_001840 [Trichoglossum hirsutum]|uniref:Major facilitator superfamily (MFS) profile domain-containing protein n=1 Tax=Trichoglossum hirsutum TaxID=265104 RepID=A0A9P8LG52_9PEZI|nr:hypothetical protein GP486_001840 [Trichoglossum hirsutum]
MAETQDPSWISRALSWTYRELGLATLASAPRDTNLLFASRFVRMFAYGSSTLILALYFSALGHSDPEIGLFMTLTLLGDVFISLLLALCADALGRRKMLMLGGLMMAGSVTPPTLDRWVLLILIRYIIAGTTATACGSLACGWFVQYMTTLPGWSAIGAYRAVFLAYACFGLVKLCLALCLSDECEIVRVVEVAEHETREGEAEPLLYDIRGSVETARDEQPPKANESRNPLVRMSKHTWLILIKLLPLFAVDSFSSGLVPL